MSDPLDDEFDIDISAEDLSNQIEIPDDAEMHDLNFTIKRALIDYKNIMNDAHRYEAKLKIEAYKLGRDFLREARTAIAKREELVLKRQFGISGGNVQKEDSKPSGSISKDRAFDELEQRRKAARNT